MMASLSKYPDTVHYRGLNTPTHIEASAHDLRVEGEIPEEIDGAFFRALHDPAYPPIFDDDVILSHDGMISKIEIKGGRVSTGVRYVHTERFLAEKKAGKALFGRYRNPFTDDPSVAGIDRTVANTTPYLHAGRLFMAKEDGLPYRIDPETLETLGKWDYQGKVRSETLTAHPKIDPETGELFLFGYEADGLASSKMAYYVFSQSGEVINEVWFDAPYCSMQHDFAITESHVVFLVYPTKGDLERMKAGGPHWIHHQHEASWVGVMPRYGSADEILWFKGPEGVHSFHVMNAFNEGSKIHIDQCLFNTNFFAFIMEPSGIDMTVDGALTRWTVDLGDKEASVVSRQIGPFCEMPVIAAADVGRAYSRGWYLTVDPEKLTLFANGPSEVLFNCVQRVSPVDGTIQSFSQGPGFGFNEPVHVPGKDGHGGWLMMMVDCIITPEHWVQEVWLLEADAIAKGPVAKIRMPFATCEQVHGTWVPREALNKLSAT
jgi:carotenoid cleavage dioxygenase